MSGQPITIAAIQKATAERYHIRLIEMVSQRRARSVARPRQVAMYLAKELTPCSLPMIGRHFGGRDHTTVMHACRVVPELMQRDRSLTEDVALIIGALRDDQLRLERIDALLSA